MREIKFRAWDKKEKRWTHQTEVCLEAGGTYWHWCDTSKQDKLLDCPDVELMQYTGLNDKNGEEIYEGDIIGYVREENDRDWMKGHDGIKYKLAARSGVVEFRDGKFVLHWHYGETYGGIGIKTKIVLRDTYPDLIDELNKSVCEGTIKIIVEVIGNIYENPELLTPNPRD